jgi:RND superfamily putative drug exporter
VVGNEVDVKVGGLTASADDFAAYTAERIPIFMGAVLLLSFLLLMLVFRSLLVPLKAVIMNLLSIGAAFGVVVAVFQWGWGASLIGVDRTTPIEAWAPVYIFAVVFGLSMDYEVFLLSRIKEEYDRTGHNATAVADGLALTARVITAAAAIMVCVFGSFVLGDEVSLKLLGLGLAVAVLVDATIVRLVLVPSTMELLGDWNWWLPKWLDRILPRVHVEASTTLEEELAQLASEDAKQPTG